MAANSRQAVRVIIVLISIFLFLLIISRIIKGNWSGSMSKRSIQNDIERAKKYKSIDELSKDLETLFKKIDYKNEVVEQTVYEGEMVVDTLPDISKFKIVTGQEMDDPAKIQVEIFSSTEKSNPNIQTDHWFVDVANDFNNAQYQLASGKTAEIRIRSIASGTGYEFIKIKKYLPDAFSPSNGLWIKMIDAAGIQTQLIADNLVPNYAGLIINKKTEKLLVDTYGDVSIKSIVDAVIKKKISAAYTNPKASSTGLNMLYTILYELANHDEAKILSDSIINSFEVFQEKVPLIASTTLHLRDLFEQGGKLDAFPNEYQTFMAMKDKDNLIFVPFGVLHSNPLYAIKEKITPEKLEVLNKFAAFTKTAKYKQSAKNYGFVDLNFKGIPEPKGDLLLKAQKVWKEHKDSGKTVYAYFLTDTSGSMSEVDPELKKTMMDQLKIALIQASKSITETNYIGLMEFNDRVTNRVDLAPFNIIQKGKFITAVNNLSPGGSTAMYNGLVSCLTKLIEQKKKDLNGKYYLFVLTDGESNKGFNYHNVLNVMVGSGVRIYPIAYGNVGQDELNKLAQVGETGLIKGTPENIVAELMTLFDLSL